MHEPLAKTETLADVVENRALCREHWRLVLRTDAFPDSCAGHFVQLACAQWLDGAPAEREQDWPDGAMLRLGGTEIGGAGAFLRRPFSLADRVDTPAGVDLHVIHRVVGVGTAWLAELRPGQRVNILGPLGRPFVMPADDEVALLVGGGVGIPPLLYLARQLAGRRAVAFFGAQTADLIPLMLTDDAPRPTAEEVKPVYNVAELARHGVPALISTDDGSYGFRGRVTAMLDTYLHRYLLAPAASGSNGGAHAPRPMEGQVKMVIYTCGPEPMLHAVADLARRYAIPAQVCVERAMACGMGTCQSCCVKVKRGDGWVYQLACTDGPVFPADVLVW